MRAEELRIGNWIEERFQSASVKKPISERDMHDIIYGAPEFWHPIPLTEGLTFEQMNRKLKKECGVTIEYTDTDIKTGLK